MLSVILPFQPWSVVDCYANSFLDIYDDYVPEHHATHEEIATALDTMHFHSSNYNKYLIEVKTICCEQYRMDDQRNGENADLNREEQAQRICKDLQKKLLFHKNALHQTLSRIHTRNIINRIQYHSNDIQLFRSALKLSRRLGDRTAEQRCIERINYLLNLTCRN